MFIQSNEQVKLGDRRLLIVLDSINRAADLGMDDAGEDRGYWGALRKWLVLAMQSRRHSEGAVSWLVISELNRRKEVKGQSPEYMADMVVKMERVQADGFVEIAVDLSRSTPSGDLGVFAINHARGTFVGDDG